MRTRKALAILVTGTTLAGGAACNASDSDAGSGSSCSATIAFIAPYTGNFAQIGQEQLHFTQYAVDQFNQAERANIKLVQGDTQLQPAQAVTVTQQFISNSKVVATVSGTSSQEILAMGPLLARAKLVDVSGAAVQDNLTSSNFTSFFRVVPRSSVQAQTIGSYVTGNLRPAKAVIVDDQSSYSTQLSSQLSSVLKGAGVNSGHESVSQKTTDYSSLVSKIGKDTDLVILAWQVAANAQQFAKAMQEQGLKATIFGTDGLFSPNQFAAAGSYVASFAPDITQVPAGQPLANAMKAKHGTFGTFGPPMYAATDVVLKAIDRLCSSGRKVTRENVLAEVRKTDDSGSVLGQPIRFTPAGDLVDGKFFIFKIAADKKYTVVESAS